MRFRWTFLSLPVILFGCSIFANAAVISPVTNGLIVGLDGSQTLFDGTSKRVQVWYDQIEDGSNASQQDYGNTTANAARNPLLVENNPMPNGSLHNVVEFKPSTTSANNDFLESKLGGNARTTTFGSSFTSGGDSTYDNMNNATWFVVFQFDPTALASRTLWRADHNWGHENVPGGTMGGPAHGASPEFGSFASGSGFGVATRDSVGQQFSNAANPGSDFNDWYIVGGVFTADTGAGMGSLTGNLLGQDQTAYPLDAGAFNAPTVLAHVLTRLGGVTNSTSSGTWDGKIAELLVFNRSLDATEYNQVQNYLNVKYFVPEPSSYILLGLSVLGTLICYRRHAA